MTGTRPPDTAIPTCRALLFALAILLTALAAGLRPDAFQSGDPGIKLIAARAALGDPAHPFNVPLPTIAGQPVPHVESFFEVHGDHAHAVTSPLFPLISAPFLAVFGLRGLYVLPALGYLLTVWALARWADTGGHERSPLTVAVIAAIATPFLFYGLEFWEHTLALAGAAAGTVFLVRKHSFASGLSLGCAALLRPEVAWFGLALLVAAQLLPERPGARTYATVIAGVALAVAPYEIWVILHFGAVTPPHLAVNAGGMTDAWVSGRLMLLRAWFGTSQTTGFWTVAPCVAGAVATVFLIRRPDHRFLWAVAGIYVLLTVLTAPNTGGGAWGPRYLLPAYLPLVLLAADAVSQLRNRSGALVIVALTVGCLWIDRSAYRELRGTKLSYGRIVDFVSEETATSSGVVTDVWWLDQVTAAITGRQFYFTPEATTGRAVVQRLSDARVPTVSVVRSATESADVSAWNTGSCYIEERRDSTSSRALVVIRLQHHCP